MLTHGEDRSQWPALEGCGVAVPEAGVGGLVPDSGTVRGQCEKAEPGFAQLDSPLVHTPVHKSL